MVWVFALPAHGALPPAGGGLLRSLRPAALRPLFVSGFEAFRLVDERGETPRFRLLDSSSRRRSLAFAINQALRARPESDKGAPSSNYVEADLERLLLRLDSADRSRLRVQVKVSGHLFELRDTIDRAAFESGRKIGLRIRSRTEDAPPLTIESSGHVALQWVAHENAIRIARAEAIFNVMAPLTEDLFETIEFKGEALRE
jgi:hypothetical protein